MGKNMLTAWIDVLETRKQQRDEEANMRGYRVSWQSDKNKVTIMSPFGDGGVFNMKSFLISNDDIKTYFNKNF